MSIDNIKVYNDDCFKILPTLKEESIDMIFADPPYFLSRGGISCSGGKMVSVDKGQWDRKSSNREIHDFNIKWILECKRVLKHNGSILISGTNHNIYSIGMALLDNGFKILNHITWQKTNPPPNLSCRYFTHSTEYIIWAKKNENSKHIFNYKLMKKLNGDKQMKDVITGPCINKKEKEFGYHPTQKPIYLLEKLILATTNENDLILDPFAGAHVIIMLGTNSTGNIRVSEHLLKIKNEKISSWCAV